MGRVESSGAIQLALGLLKATHAGQLRDFVGLGVVLYVLPIDFPSVPLGGWLSPKPKLPITGTREIGKALVQLSSQSSQWHDGFHLIDYGDQALTHVSQFLAPDLGNIVSSAPAELPTGARQLTALLISGYRSVGCVGLLTKDDQISIYREGQLQMRMPASRA